MNDMSGEFGDDDPIREGAVAADAWLPPEAPLAMPVQCLERPPGRLGALWDALRAPARPAVGAA